MELTLKLLSGRGAGREIKVGAAKFLIGRAEDCHLRPHSDMISRHHCVVLVEEGFCAIRDLASRNGTFVNGEQVVGQRELHNGDQLKVAHLEFEVQLTSRVGGKSRSKVKSVKEAAQRTAASKPPAQSADEDISDWLSDGDDTSETHELDLVETKMPPHETPEPGPTRETIFLKAASEETIASEAPTEEPKNAQPPAPEEMAPKKATPGAAAAKRLFGGGAKPGGQSQSGHKDSREAAADALKKFFTNRKP